MPMSVLSPAHEAVLAPVETICVIGMGLIGASFAAAIRKAGFSGKITAVTRSPSTTERVLERGLADSAGADMVQQVAGADVVLLAIPMLAMREQLIALEPLLGPNTIVTDAGSVKSSFIDDARSALKSLHRVVPGHPIAGGENSGVDACNVALFNDRRVLLTPLPESDEEAVNCVAALWELCGAAVQCMEPAHHDRVLAATSHLPHVLAFALVDTLATHQQAEEIFSYAAGGLRDFTRIASSDAIMWRDVCLTNKEAIGDALDSLDAHMKRLREAIDSGDGNAIEAIFSRAKSARDQYIKQH